MEDRVIKLERDLRRWRFVSLGAFAIASVAVLVAASPWLTGEVRANRFTLVNMRGEEVGGLGFDGQDEPRLALQHRRNQGTVIVGALAEDIAGVGIMGKTVRATLATDADGFPAVSLSANDATASLAVSRAAQPTLFIKAGATNLLATSSAIRIREPTGNVFVLPSSAGSGAAEPRGPAKP